MMKYKELYAAMLSEMEKRKLNKVQIVELAHLNYSTFNTWINTGCKPEKSNSITSFLKLVDMLGINIDEFANHETLAGRLELLRWKNGLSISELSEKSGVSDSVIHQIEFNGFKNAKLNSLEKLSASLGTTVDYLANGETKPVRNGLVDLPKVEVNDIIEAGKKAGVLEDSVRKFIEIKTRTINGEQVNSVSAHELYLDLGLMNNKWARWSETNIVENNFFSVNADFIELPFVGSEKTRGNFAKDYAVTIEFAKHIAMMAKTQRAHDYRNYFLECEKVAKGEQQKIEPVTKPALSISELNNEFRAAREIVSNRGFINGELNNAAAKLLKEFVGVDLDAIIGVPKKKMDVSKMSQRELVSA